MVKMEVMGSLLQITLNYFHYFRLLQLISGCRMMQAINELHTGKTYFFANADLRAGLDADYGGVLVVARIMRVTSIDLEVVLFSDATNAT